MLEKISGESVIKYLPVKEVREIIDNTINFSTEIDRDGTFIISMIFGGKELKFKSPPLNPRP